MPYPRRPSLFDGLLGSFSVQPEEGEPQVSDLLNDLIQQAGQPYMERYYLLGQNNTGSPNARYHHILQSDQAALHDHPWDFVSVILSGTYVETTPTSEQQFGPGSVLVRKAEQLHRLTLPDGPVWTFVVVGAPRRGWGFATDDGWVPWVEYLNPGLSSRSW